MTVAKKQNSFCQQCQVSAVEVELDTSANYKDVCERNLLKGNQFNFDLKGLTIFSVSWPCNYDCVTLFFFVS